MVEMEVQVSLTPSMGVPPSVAMTLTILLLMAALLNLKMLPMAQMLRMAPMSLMGPMGPTRKPHHRCQIVMMERTRPMKRQAVHLVRLFVSTMKIGGCVLTTDLIGSMSRVPTERSAGMASVVPLPALQEILSENAQVRLNIFNATRLAHRMTRCLAMPLRLVTKVNA
jgi:hypothetical protein